MKKCKYCGAEIDDNIKSCPSCGSGSFEKMPANNFFTKFVDNIQNRDETKEDESVDTQPKTAFIVAILGLITTFMGLGIVGIILAFIGLKIDKEGKYKGLNTLTIVIGIVLFAIEVILFSSAFGTIFEYSFSIN